MLSLYICEDLAGDEICGDRYSRGALRNVIENGIEYSNHFHIVVSSPRWNEEPPERTVDIHSKARWKGSLFAQMGICHKKKKSREDDKCQLDLCEA